MVGLVLWVLLVLLKLKRCESEDGDDVVINEGVTQSFTLFFSVTCVTCDMN